MVTSNTFRRLREGRHKNPCCTTRPQRCGLLWPVRNTEPESLADVIDSMTAAVAKKLEGESLIPYG
jgi:hypothetical protein